MSIRAILLLIAFAAVRAMGADAPPVEGGKAPAKTGIAKIELSEEERWAFEPVTGRTDPFYDLRARMKLERELPQESGPETGPNPILGSRDKTQYAKAQTQKVEALIVAKKWDEAIKTCDAAIKALSKDPDNEEARQYIEKFKRYRTQADEAKTYEEAQAKFDALDLRIEGILWSPDGSLAVISGEPRARGVNERVKDCVIINIDTNRVDFLFHYNRRRFEFQRYVGEDVKSAAKK